MGEKKLTGRKWLEIERELRELNKGRDPWDILEGETIEEYKLFCIYRELKHQDRRYPKVSEITKVPLGTIGRIAAKNRWRERAFLYDIHLERLRAQVRENAVTSLSLIAQEAIEKLLRAFVSKIESASLEEIPLDMIDKLISATIKLQEAILTNKEIGKVFMPKENVEEEEKLEIEAEEINEVEGEFSQEADGGLEE